MNGDILLDTLDLDVAIVNNDLALVDAPESISQYLGQKLRCFYGEWFLDQSIGLPYLQEILGKGTPSTVIDSILKSAIIRTPGIQELISFSMSLDNATRLLTVSFTARDIEDQIIVFKDLALGGV